MASRVLLNGSNVGARMGVRGGLSMSVRQWMPSRQSVVGRVTPSRGRVQSPYRSLSTSALVPFTVSGVRQCTTSKSRPPPTPPDVDELFDIGPGYSPPPEEGEALDALVSRLPPHMIQEMMTGSEATQLALLNDMSQDDLTRLLKMPEFQNFLQMQIDKKGEKARAQEEELEEAKRQVDPDSIDPYTATDEEKMKAFKAYLDDDDRVLDNDALYDNINQYTRDPTGLSEDPFSNPETQLRMDHAKEDLKSLEEDIAKMKKK
eukprot:TRINITY_DN13137_c0_g1_i1.p1 TRINITY_DN13137_c0_g1~~TRINITY_DN13137_c0_g1_i1.p1  ORF type:complete len:261 (+),score=73.72 TRINITY_DN13137_c0_g1_i1:2-784(+)